MNDIIKNIAQWQVDAGNASKPYDDFLESSFQVEEALEPFAPNAKEEAREFIGIYKLRQLLVPEDITDVDRLDKACDAIVYAIGSMTKLGLDHHKITEALTIVNNANQQKLGAKRDSDGKLGKPDNFVSPEPKLQVLLDSIKK